VFTSPRLDASERLKFYERDEYTLQPFGSALWSYPRIGLIKSYTNGKRLLDVGCGSGNFLDAAAKCGFDASGMDISSRMAAISTTKGLNVRYGTAETIRTTPSSFDIVTFWDVLEHVPDPQTFLSTVGRMLAHRGIVAFSVPNFNSSGAGWFKGSWFSLMPYQHLWHFTPDAVRKTMSEANLKVEFLTADPLNPCNFGRLNDMAGIARKA